MQLYERRKMFLIYRDGKKSRTLVRKGQIQNTGHKWERWSGYLRQRRRRGRVRRAFDLQKFCLSMTS